MFTAQIVLSLIPAAEHIRASIGEFPEHTDGQRLRDVGWRLDKHFQKRAEIVDRLTKDGWKFRHHAHATFAQHPDITEVSEIVFRLKAIGIDPKTVSVTTTWHTWADEQLELPKTKITGKELMEALGFKDG